MTFNLTFNRLARSSLAGGSERGFSLNHDLPTDSAYREEGLCVITAAGKSATANTQVMASDPIFPCSPAKSKS